MRFYRTLKLKKTMINTLVIRLNKNKLIPLKPKKPKQLIKNKKILRELEMN